MRFTPRADPVGALLPLLNEWFIIISMTRSRSSQRLDNIVAAATEVFMRRGYVQARMEHVAEAAGIAPGTLYLYVEGKESLFELALRRAFHDRSALELELPYAGGSVVERSWQLVRDAIDFPLMFERPHLREAIDVRSEFTALVSELYDWLSHHWQGVRMIERCASDWPELHAYFYKDLRRDGLNRWTEYLDHRGRQGHLRAMPDTATAARVIMETIAFFAMHRHTAPDSDMPDDVARTTVLAILTSAFVP